MRLNEFFTSRKKLTEVKAMPGVGAIHISEIEPTLDYLEKLLHIDLKNNVIGSVGKKEFSGDMDVALDIPAEEIPAFMEKLDAMPEILDMAQTSVIITKIKIAGYDPSNDTDKYGKVYVRTGYVQLDFMPGDPKWKKVYYHSPTEEESKYKGVFRNILLNDIAINFNRQASDEKIPDGRPAKVTRFMWSPKLGLVQIVRTPAMNKAGTGYTKTHNDAIVAGPWKSPEEIVHVLNLGDINSLNSYESLKIAIEKNYPTELVQKILTDFANNVTVKDIGVPEDIQQLVAGE